MDETDRRDYSREELEKMPDEELETLYDKVLKEVPQNMTLINDIADILDKRKEQAQGQARMSDGNGEVENSYANEVEKAAESVDSGGDIPSQPLDGTAQENEKKAEHERTNRAEADIKNANQENSASNSIAANKDEKYTVEQLANMTGVLLANCNGGPFSIEEFNDELAKAENIKVIVEPGKAEGYLNAKGWEYAHNDLDTVLRFANEDTVIAEHINDKSYLLLDNEEKVYDSQGKGEDGRNQLDGEDIRGKVEEDKGTTLEETVEQYQRGDISESEALRYLKSNGQLMTAIAGGVAATSIAAETLMAIGTINANMPGIGLAETAGQLVTNSEVANSLDDMEDTNPLAKSIESGEMPVGTNEFHSVGNMAGYDSNHPETDKEQHKREKDERNKVEREMTPYNGNNGGGN